MNILVTGKNGQLGRSLHQIITTKKQHDTFVFVDRAELNFEKIDDFDQYFQNHHFDCIINCAAYTAVDAAESETKLADQINHLAVKKIAIIAQQHDIELIHISTDYVFDGKNSQPYVETDKTSPINVYGKTKLAGERAIQELMPTNATIIRTSWVYSAYGNNFVDTMLRLGRERDELNIIDDQRGSPTYANDLADVILKILHSRASQQKGYTTQIYHYANADSTSWYRFAKEIFSLSKTPCNIKPITTAQYPTPAARPKNTIMSKDKIIKKFNLKIPNWKKSLYTCITSLDKKN